MQNTENWNRRTACSHQKLNCLSSLTTIIGDWKLYCYRNGNHYQNYMVLKFSLQTLQNAPRVGLQTAYIVVLARLSDNGHSKIRDHVIKSSDVTRVGTNKWVIACMWVRSVTALGLTAECTGNLTINQLPWRWTECIYHLIRIHSGSHAYHSAVQCSHCSA